MSENNKNHAEIRKFGVVLRRLAPEYLEIVRLWRNDQAVSQWLVFQGQIGPEQQQKWFDGLDQNCHFYYVIEYQGQPIGLVNLKNYDATVASAEGGVFIGEQSFQNGMAALQALLAMYDFGFEVMGLKEITAYIMIGNSRAVRLNQALGFRRVPDQPGRADKTELWTLQPERYRTQTARLREYLSVK